MHCLRDEGANINCNAWPSLNNRLEILLVIFLSFFFSLFFLIRNSSLGGCYEILRTFVLDGFVNVLLKIVRGGIVVEK